MLDWRFCSYCGEVYRSDKPLQQFCSKSCINHWINEVDLIGLFNFVSNIQKDANKYRIWHKRVLANWNNKCAICGSEEKLQTHHIVPYFESQELAYDSSNGIVLCSKCHGSIHLFKIFGEDIGTKEERKEIRQKYIEITGINYYKG